MVLYKRDLELKPEELNNLFSALFPQIKSGRWQYQVCTSFKFISVISVFILAGCAGAGRALMIDGKIETLEWVNAGCIRIDDANLLLFREDQAYYYLAIKSQLPKPIFVDLFLQIDDTLYNIHASSQLGDRVLKDTLWTDSEPATQWGQNRDWIANTVRFNRTIMQRLSEEDFQGDVHRKSVLPYDGFEFQLAKERWKLNYAQLRIEIKSMSDPDMEEVVFPTNSTRYQATNWTAIF